MIHVSEVLSGTFLSFSILIPEKQYEFVIETESEHHFYIKYVILLRRMTLMTYLPALFRNSSKFPSILALFSGKLLTSSLLGTRNL